MTSLISKEMEGVVGRDYRWATSFPIAASDIRRWAVAVYYPDPPPPLYWDEDYAARTRWGGIVAPEEFNPFAWMRAEPRGDMGNNARKPWPELHLGVEPPETRANILGGLQVRHTDIRMRPGDVIRSTQRLVKYHEREGRLGLMLFTTMADKWINQLDEVVRESTTVLIRYR